MDNKVTWKVTTQQETQRPDSTGRFVPGMLVGFTTSAGVNGSVFVPDSQYTRDNVQQLIQERVDKLADVQSLQG